MKLVHCSTPGVEVGDHPGGMARPRPWTGRVEQAELVPVEAADGFTPGLRREVDGDGARVVVNGGDGADVMPVGRRDPHPDRGSAGDLADAFSQRLEFVAAFTEHGGGVVFGGDGCVVECFECGGGAGAGEDGDGPVRPGDGGHGSRLVGQPASVPVGGPVSAAYAFRHFTDRARRREWRVG